MKKLICILILAVTSLQMISQQSKAFEVKVTGKGQPIILIPGYSCSGDVWNETVEHLAGKYELHVLTLAGYAGVKPLESETILMDIKNGIIAYVKEKKLKQPMIIGHSLGAFMALWLQSSEPGLFGKAVCVDGVPFISALSNPDIVADSLVKKPQYNKQAVIARFKSMPDSSYVKNMIPGMLYQVSDTARARQIAVWSYKSDRATLGSTIVEISLTDLRKDLAKIKTENLVLASKFGSKEKSTEIYNTQYAQLKNKTIKVADSKHFIMYDAPQWFYNEIDLFLAK